MYQCEAPHDIDEFVEWCHFAAIAPSAMAMKFYQPTEPFKEDLDWENHILAKKGQKMNKQQVWNKLSQMYLDSQPGSLESRTLFEIMDRPARATKTIEKQLKFLEELHQMVKDVDLSEFEMPQENYRNSKIG